ncbi:toll/interleukin-1 receptor domain-containing protein [Algoriphagus sp. C2-6-M1]|uniref:toll/interleukin-1 receptor domain-containing protein n=1 Tax=Algoriphagus persicinus TaxID=3108754 RepID=UPI002B36B7BF|nr:toll/interleukin-1 receptor domain-containing protein [Algoriphagus sp. C2-6-M1]MEB2779852.1 toll/interleukin-1 receptor domain-containing protein [Algoriphagus sp. C2-6-M1]
MEKGKIFISYRQSDTQSEASRLKEDLEEVFGEENVFFDIETLEPGLNFADAIEKTIRQSKVVLVLIGPTWADVKDDEGNLRLFNENDWVRREVAMALTMEDTRVIPILLKKASLPTADGLPDNIKSLAEKHWKEITISRWRYDVGVLIKSIEHVIPPIKKPEPEPSPRPRPIPKPQKSWWAKNYLWVLIVFIVLLILALIPDDDAYYDMDTSDTAGNQVGEELSQLDINTLQEENPASNEIYESLQLEADAAPTPTVEAGFDYSGKWWLYENGIRSGYFIIHQNGGYYTFDYYYFDNHVGEGTGEYDGTYLYSTSFGLYDTQGSYSFSFGSNTRGESWVGQTQANGLLTNAELRRN